MIIRSWDITLFFAWFDLWIGAYYDRAHRRLSILPVPCLGVRIQFGSNPALWRCLDEVAQYIMFSGGSVMDMPGPTLNLLRIAYKLPECPKCERRTWGWAKLLFWRVWHLQKCRIAVNDYFRENIVGTDLENPCCCRSYHERTGKHVEECPLYNLEEP